MKVLIINEFDECGGTEVQVNRECNYLQEREIEVFLFIIKKKSNRFLNASFPVFYYDEGDNVVNPFGRLKTLLGADYRLYKKLREIVNDFKPDYVHIHNVFYSPISVYTATNGYFTIQTLRDFSVVCPKSTLCQKEWRVCKNLYSRRCWACVCESVEGIDKFKYFIKTISLKRINTFRRKYVDRFISPSRKLAECCKELGIEADVINNPFDKNLICNENLYKDRNYYIYVGCIGEYKGVFQLIKAFNTFSHDKGCRLKLIGPFLAKDKEKVLNMIGPNIDVLGELQYEQVIEEMSRAYCLILPSLWMENYPNVVLEAFARQCVVIASNRGGAYEQLDDDRRMFDILCEQDILAKLEYVNQMDIKDLLEIKEKQLRYLCTCNDINKYYLKLFGV